MTHPTSGTTTSTQQRTLSTKEKKIFVLKDVEKRYNWVQETTGHGTIILTIQNGNIVFIETAIKEKP